MASPLRDVKEYPAPERQRMRAFLASCPAFSGFDPVKLEQLAGELRLMRYEDGTRFFSDVPPDQESPLRFVVQGRASWDSERALEQKSAWMLTPGSLMGVEGLNDWARRNQVEGAWDRGESPRINCQATGPIWVLELPADRFEAALRSSDDHAVLDRLLEHVPTCVYSPDIVATMRKSSQFVRAATLHLFKLLEWAPTKVYNDPNEGDLPWDEDLGLTAAYYVIEGELRVTVDTDVKTIGPGEMDGVALFRSSEDGLSMPYAIGRTAAVVLTKDMLQTYIRLTPGFARTLGPHSEQEVHP